MPLSEKAARSKDRSTGMPTLQHRHFAFIASMIRDIPTPSARLEAAETFLSKVYLTNPAFNSSRFLEACNCDAANFTDGQLDRAIAHATFWLDHLIDEKTVERGTANTEEAA